MCYRATMLRFRASPCFVPRDGAEPPRDGAEPPRDGAEQSKRPECLRATGLRLRAWNSATARRHMLGALERAVTREHTRGALYERKPGANLAKRARRPTNENALTCENE